MKRSALRSAPGSVTRSGACPAHRLPGEPVPRPDADEAILATLLSLDRSVRWTLDGGVQLGFDALHPQGMVLVDDTWWISTVDLAAGAGWLLAADRDGALVGRWSCGVADRHHPGGIDVDVDESLWLAVAEYRPASTTDVYHLLPGGVAEHRFRHADHLGAIAAVGDGSLVAWTWGSRELLRFDTAGNVLVRRINPSHFVDHQDLHVLGTGHAVCSGVGRSLGGGGRKLGGIGVLRLDDLTWELELPFPGYSPATDQVATYNPMHLDVAEGRLRIHLLPDQGDGTIYAWSVPLAG